MTSDQRILTTNKEVAEALGGKNPRYVTDMRRGGFQLPCTPREALNFLRRHPRPTHFRQSCRGGR